MKGFLRRWLVMAAGVVVWVVVAGLTGALGVFAIGDVAAAAVLLLSLVTFLTLVTGREQR
jgi:hypothetical protein